MEKENKGINVLSLFDGASCGQIALARVGKKVNRYIASEIKPHAIKHVGKLYPNTEYVGDVRNIIIENNLIKGSQEIILDAPIDLLIGGSPCKGISRLNQKQEGLKHKESILFWEYVRILKELRKTNSNVQFLLENTHGNKEATSIITEVLGVEPISINSKLVSAQNRPRYYWTNIQGVIPPKDKNITTLDVFTYDGEIAPSNRIKWLEGESGKKSIQKGYTRVNPYPKSGCITANGHRKWNENYLFKNGEYRFLSKNELEKLQTFPIGWSEGLNYDEAYDLIGDGWTIDVIVEFFKNLNK